MNINWHVITDEDLGFSLNFKDSWITNYVCPNDGVEFWARCHGALNWFIDSQELKDDEMYCFMNDDDGYEPDFFTKVDDAVKETVRQHGSIPDVLIVSMLRGDQTPAGLEWPRSHPTWSLFAHPQNMQPGHVGLEQILLSGEVLKKHRLSLDHDGDGQFIVQATQNNFVTYAPHIFALFNYFEPGRWNK